MKYSGKNRSPTLLSSPKAVFSLSKTLKKIQFWKIHLKNSFFIKKLWNTLGKIGAIHLLRLHIAPHFRAITRCFHFQRKHFNKKKKKCRIRKYRYEKYGLEKKKKILIRKIWSTKLDSAHSVIQLLQSQRDPTQGN